MVKAILNCRIINVQNMDFRKACYTKQKICCQNNYSYFIITGYALRMQVCAQAFGNVTNFKIIFINVKSQALLRVF